MTIHVATYSASCTLATSTAHSLQFKNETESDIVPLQTSTLCEVVKFVKQKSRKSDVSHPVSMKT